MTKLILAVLFLSLATASAALADGPEEGRDSGGGYDAVVDGRDSGGGQEVFNGGRDSGGFTVEAMAKQEPAGRCVSAGPSGAQASACELADNEWVCRQVSHGLISQRRSQFGCRWITR